MQEYYADQQHWMTVMYVKVEMLIWIVLGIVLALLKKIVPVSVMVMQLQMLVAFVKVLKLTLKTVVVSLKLYLWVVHLLKLVMHLKFH